MKTVHRIDAFQMPKTDLPLARHRIVAPVKRFMSTATPSSAPAEQAVIKTTYGDMTIGFWPEVAPKHVENFKKLAREGFYDGTAFHRIIKGFMIQGGCPNTKAGARGIPGTGDPGYKVKAEFNDKPHVRGVISAARSAHPDSAGCQFFICHGDARFLDKQYTAFGKLVGGDDVLERIANVPTKSGDGGEKSTPIDRVEVQSVKIVPAA
jgi:peptidyl-prolyl cis-trans isomerase B (cyclophilin B)